MNNQTADELRSVEEVLRKAAEDARIRALYHPTHAQQMDEIARAKRIEKHADSLFSRL